MGIISGAGLLTYSDRKNIQSKGNVWCKGGGEGLYIQPMPWKRRNARMRVHHEEVIHYLSIYLDYHEETSHYYSKPTTGEGWILESHVAEQN